MVGEGKTVANRGEKNGSAFCSVEINEFWHECARLRPGLIRAAARYGVETEAEDIVHEAFIRAAGHRELDLGRLTPFLVSVTKRLCVDDIRRRVATQQVGTHRRLLPVPLVGPEETVVDREQARWIIARFGRLSERECFVLFGLDQGLSHGEIARLLGTTRRATESIASRARRRVRDLVARRALRDRVPGD